MYFEDCECLLFLFLNCSYTFGVTLFSAEGSLFMQEKIIFWERHLLIRALAPTLFEENLGLWVFEMPYISISQDLFFAFYPNLLPAYLWHTWSFPVSAIFRLIFFFCPQQTRHRNNSGFNFETEVHVFVWIYVIHTQRTNRARILSPGGESLLMEFLWDLWIIENWRINS